MKVLCLALTLLPLLAGAEDFILADGTKIGGKVTRVDPDGLVVQTVRGSEKLPYYALTVADQKRFGLTTRKAEEFRLQQKDVRARQLAEQVRAVQAQAAALERKIQEAPTAEQLAMKLRVAQSAFTADAALIQGTAEGVLARVTTQRGKAAPTALDKSTLQDVNLGTGFIFGLRGAEGETWRGTLYPAGYHAYVTDFGTTRNVRAFATSVEAALQHGADGSAPAPGNVEAPRGRLPGSLRGDTALDPRRR